MKAFRLFLASLALLSACSPRGLSPDAENLRARLAPGLWTSALELAKRTEAPGREFEGQPALQIETLESRFDEQGTCRVRCRFLATETVMTYEAECIEALIVGVAGQNEFGGWVRFRVTSAVRKGEPVIGEGTGYPPRFGGRRGGFGLPVPQPGSWLSAYEPAYRAAAEQARVVYRSRKHDISPPVPSPLCSRSGVLNLERRALGVGRGIEWEAVKLPDRTPDVRRDPASRLPHRPP